MEAAVLTGMNGTVFTLFVVPAVYTVVAKTHRRAEEPDVAEPLLAEAYSSSSAGA